MKIVNTFAIVNNNLISVQFEGNDSDEFTMMFDNWNDIEYLTTFFKENEKDLSAVFWNNISINEAVNLTIKDAEKLENYIYELAVKGESDQFNTLQTLFKPLENNDFTLRSLQESKAKGKAKDSWLRVYAIRIAPNYFVVSGGGIKLTEKMYQSDHLKVELQKLQATKDYLLENGVLDENDYEFLEII